MRIIISPAKKMNIDTDSLAPAALPQFIDEAEKIASVLQAMDFDALQALWRCSDSIAAQNVERLRHMDLRKNLTPAILSYKGIQYQYMAPGVFEDRQFDYIGTHLRILSGFYGLLRPFDGIAPHRLEMQAKLAVDGHQGLYAFWGSRLAEALCAETDLILNLASKEYSRAVTAHLPKTVRVLSCIFGELKNERVIEKATLCKMARGEMVRDLAERQVESSEEIKAFCRLGYSFSEAHSTEDRFVFLKETGAFPSAAASS
jgi:cytoplasmic iron level regulating protein YaaA (DUF328/UPF0246 family)